jgi:hypothetical protein
MSKKSNKTILTNQLTQIKIKSQLNKKNRRPKNRRQFIKINPTTSRLRIQMKKTLSFL